MGLIVLLLFAAILASLGSALYYLLRSKGSSAGVVRALTVRIGLSMLLFLLLMLAWWAGLIEPHGVQPIPPSG
ncbi:MAG: twin transmembrane helix small protein [Gammaproteobacteria bacterium]|nr:twin transmembrane helix small protein [Gammaproteobacteria bacterium]